MESDRGSPPGLEQDARGGTEVASELAWLRTAASAVRGPGSAPAQPLVPSQALP